MVSVERFRIDAENVVNEIEQRCNSLEECAYLKFVLVRNAQRIFRGYSTRKYIKLLNDAAVCIQRNWRGFLGRNIYEELLKEKFEELCRYHYNKMAITIQRLWKGYWIRSRIFSYYKLKGWLQFVSLQNKNLKSKTEKYHRIQNDIELKKREEEAKEWIVYILFKLHHLLRTHQITGIYSLPKTRNLSEIEKMLNCLKYKDFMTFYNSYKEDVSDKKIKEMPPYILQHCKYPAHFEREFYEHKILHKDLFVENSRPPDRFLRYENTDSNMNYKIQDTNNSYICECSFCKRERD